MQCLFAPLKYAYLHVLKSQLSITQNPNYGILIMPVEKENTLTFYVWGGMEEHGIACSFSEGVLVESWGSL